MSSDHDWGHNSAVNNEDPEGCREMEFCDNDLNATTADGCCLLGETRPLFISHYTLLLCTCKEFACPDSLRCCGFVSTPFVERHFFETFLLNIFDRVSPKCIVLTS